MTKMFDRFLKNPEEISIGPGNGDSRLAAAPAAAGSDGAPPPPLSPADHSWITGVIETAAGAVPVVATRLGRSDRLGTILARLSINRMSFSVRPGLYAVGEPDAWSSASS